jgi:hypothetical protein
MVCLLAAMLAATTTAIAQQPPPRKTGALAPGGSGLIAGRVADPVSGQGVSGAVVWLLIDGVMRPESPRVLSDVEGRFVFVNVPAGRYSFQAQKTGYLRGLLGARSVMDEGRELDLADGQLLTDLTLPIWKYAAIGGTVTDEAGEPVAGVSVRTFRKIVSSGEIRFSPAFQAAAGITDDRGVYRISSLVPGEYLVAVPSTLTTFPAEIMRELERPEMVDEAFGAISRLAPLGSALNQQLGASVIMGTNRTLIPPWSADDVPAVYRTTLFPGTAKLAEATAIALRPGEERSGIDINLRPVRAGRVSGQIAGPDGPVGPAAVRLIPWGDAMLSPSRDFDVATGMSDGAGRFTLLGVPEGQYVVWIEKRLAAPSGQPPDTRPLLSALEPVAVASAGTTQVSVTLKPAARITLRLEMRDGRTVRPQDAELFVEPVGVGGRANVFPDSSKPTVVHLPPGRYVVTASVSKSACTAALLQGRDVSDEVLELRTDDVDITIVCGDQPTLLTGTVRGERGAPDSDALVVAFPMDRRFWEGPGLRVRRKASAQAGAAGSFSLSNLPPGEYLVAALPVGASDFWQDPQVLDKLTPLATRVSLPAGEARTVDVRTVRIR